MLSLYLAQVLVTSLHLGACPPQSLYSARALHRVRTQLQLRILQERRARLAAARAAILHHISIDAILALPDDARVLQGSEASRLKHLRPSGTSICQ